MEKNKANILSRVSPEMKKVMDFEERQRKDRIRSGEENLTDREAYEASRSFFNEGGPVMERVEEIFVDYEGRRISCTLYDPVNRPHNKAILFIHGGGFVVGSPKTHDGIQRRLAHLTKAVVLSMDYSLAPEVKFPVQIYECAAVLQHLKDHGARYGIDSGNISLAGDSAGAYLSLDTAVYLRDRGETDAIRSLLLFYGSYGLQDSRSMRLYGNEYDGLTLSALHSYSTLFCDEKDREHPLRNLFLSDLTYGLPPAFILSCTLDPLADDSSLLYEILKEHDLQAEYVEYDGVLHGFLHYSRMMKDSEKAIRDAVSFYQKQCSDK